MTGERPGRRLRRLRRELRGYRVTDTAGDLTYTIYVVVLTALMYGPMLAQALRAAGQTMPDAARPSSTTVAGAVVALGVVALVAGRQLGPLRTTPAEVEHFLRGQVPPHLVLRRRALGAIAALAALLAAVTTGLGFGAGLPGERITLLAAVAGAGGAVVGGLWVRVQSVGTHANRPGLSSVLSLRRALTTLDPDGLLARLERWRAAGRSFMAGDARGAALRVTEAPRSLRHRRLRTSTRLPLLIASRDWLGAQRALPRFARSIVVSLVAVGVLAAGAAPGTLTAAVAALALFGASAAWTEGLAAHADHADAGVVPGAPGRLFVLHLAFPALVATLALIAGSVGAVGVRTFLGDGFGGAVSGASGASLAYAVAVTFLAVATRAWVASQSVMPPSVLTPVVTPVGDLSPVIMGSWYARGWIVVLGVVLGMRWIAPDSGASTWTAFVGALVLAAGVSKVSRR